LEIVILIFPGKIKATITDNISILKLIKSLKTLLYCINKNILAFVCFYSTLFKNYIYNKLFKKCFRNNK